MQGEGEEEKKRMGKEEEEEFLMQTHGAILGEWQCCKFRKFHARLKARLGNNLVGRHPEKI